MQQNINIEKEQNLYKKQIAAYTDVIELYCKELISAGKSNQVIKNCRSAVNSWRSCLHLNEVIGKEFHSDFKSYVKKYINIQKRQNIKKTTYETRLTHIRNSRLFYLQNQSFDLLPQSFQERFKYLLEINNYTVASFWRLHLSDSITYQTLSKWIRGSSQPHLSMIHIVKLIEQSLYIRSGTLLETLLIPTKKSDIYSLPFSMKVSEALSKGYYIWTEKLKQQFAELVIYKTALVPPNNMLRNKMSIWTGGTTKLPPTAQFVKNDLLSFFGFCYLPANNTDPMLRGLGMKKEEITFALLAEPDILEKFVTGFRLLRSGGKYNHGALHFINVVTSLLRRDTGYLYQKPEIGMENGSVDSAESWKTKCLQARKRLIGIKEFIESEKQAGGENFELGRDPEEPIKWILDQPSPLRILMKMTTDMINDVRKLTTYPAKQAVHFRDTLLIAMLQANPLRINMFKIMKLGEHLIKMDDGSWWIKFKRSDFKNRKVLNSDYSIRLNQEIWELINIYVKKFRPMLNKDTSSNYVFLFQNRSLPVGERKHDTLKGRLNEIVRERTRQYIPNCSGFGPHAFRHIIATDIIKSDTLYGYLLASKVLHDKLETVEKYYAHLKTNDFFEPYNNHFSKIIKSSGSFELNS